jgi:single-strand DNA-binding protein
MNKVELFGRMTADAELRSVGENGTKVANFTLAVDRFGKKDETDFIRCVAWGKTAELVSTYVKKGRQLVVVGELRTGSYKIEKDGVEFTQYTSEVNTNEVHFVNDGKGKTTQADNSEAPVANSSTDHNTDYKPAVTNLENLDSMDAIPSLF